MRDSRAFFRASLLLGVGLGGLIDGIVLHQVLQWHHMLSAPVPPVTVEALQLNTLADGTFHLLAWVVTLAGVLWLARTPRPGHGSAASLAGGLLVGWGGFNLVEGLANHYLLGIHHVRAGTDAWAYDLAALIASVALIGAGITVSRRARATRWRVLRPGPLARGS
jgi:uncharacterized membrane protein